MRSTGQCARISTCARMTYDTHISLDDDRRCTFYTHPAINQQCACSLAHHGHNTSSMMVKTLCDRDDSLFMAVLPTRRLRAPVRMIASACSTLVTVSSLRPSTCTPCYTKVGSGRYVSQCDTLHAPVERRQFASLMFQGDTTRMQCIIKGRH